MRRRQHPRDAAGQSLVEYGVLVAVFGALAALVARVEGIVHGLFRLIGL